ncbi:MAG: O-antigen ligase family protein, partial [Candidatus Omnitrophota bacterium]|nr:O-antigen ligase family protein [Candidatus Omnitrophota bacterium]
MLRIDAMISVLDRLSAWSIYLLIFALPFSKSIVEITIVTALVCVVLKNFLLKEDTFCVKKIENKFLYIFLFVSLLSIFNSYAPLLSVKALFSKSLKFAALFLITGHCINTREKLKNFMIVASISCALILIDGFTQYYITHIDFLHSYPSFKYVLDQPLELGAVTASFPFPNDFAAWILMFVFPIGVYFMFGPCGWKARIFFACLSAGLLYSLALTKVRGAWAAFLLALGMLFFSRLGKAGVILLAAILLFTMFVNPGLKSYVTSLTSAADRAAMWNVGWEIFKEHPIIGNGVNTFFEKFKINRLD